MFAATSRCVLCVSRTLAGQSTLSRACGTAVVASLDKRVDRQPVDDERIWRQRSRRIRDGTQARTASEYGSGLLEHRATTAEIGKLGRQRRWEEALALFATMNDPDLVLRAAAVDACAKAKQYVWARRLFDEMPRKTPSAYNSMLAMLVQLERPHEAEVLIGDMRGAHLSPNEDTFMTLLVAHGRKGSVENAFRVFGEMQAAGIPATSDAYSAIMAACARDGQVQRARDVLAQLESEGIRATRSMLISMIWACARLQQEAAAIEAFDDMRRRGFKPCVIAYTSLIACFDGDGALRRAEAAFAEMQKEGVEPDTAAYNALLRIALRSNAPDDCRRILAAMEERGLTKTDVTKRLMSHVDTLETELREVPEAGLASSSLPAGWRQTLDPSSGRFYYWFEANHAGTTTWERPA